MFLRASILLTDNVRGQEGIRAKQVQRLPKSDEGLFGAVGSEGQTPVSKVKDKAWDSLAQHTAARHWDLPLASIKKESGNLLPIKASASLNRKDLFLIFLLKRKEKGRKHKGTALSLCFLKDILRNPGRPTQKQCWGNFLSICQVAKYF